MALFLLQVAQTHHGRYRTAHVNFDENHGYYLVGVIVEARVLHQSHPFQVLCSIEILLLTHGNTELKSYFARDMYFYSGGHGSDELVTSAAESYFSFTLSMHIL